MYKWHLPLLALLAILQPIASFAERNLVDGRLCCDRLSNSLLRDTRLPFYEKHRPNLSGDRRLNNRDNREAQGYEIRGDDNTLSRLSSESRLAEDLRNRVANRITSLETTTFKRSDLRRVSDADRQFQRFSSISADRETTIRDNKISYKDLKHHIRREYRDKHLHDFNDRRHTRTSREDIRKERTFEDRRFVRVWFSIRHETRRNRDESAYYGLQKTMENRNLLQKERNDIARINMRGERKTRSISAGERIDLNRRIDFRFLIDNNREKRSATRRLFTNIQRTRDENQNSGFQENNNRERRSFDLHLSSVERTDQIRNREGDWSQRHVHSNTRNGDSSDRNTVKMESRLISQIELRSQHHENRKYKSASYRSQRIQIIKDEPRSDSRSKLRRDMDRHLSSKTLKIENYSERLEPQSRRLINVRNILREENRNPVSAQRLLRSSQITSENDIKILNRDDISRNLVNKRFKIINDESDSRHRSMPNMRGIITQIIPRARVVERSVDRNLAELSRHGIKHVHDRNERITDERQNTVKETRTYNREEKRTNSRVMNKETPRIQNRETSLHDKDNERKEIDHLGFHNAKLRNLRTTRNILERSVINARSRLYLDYTRNRDVVSIVWKTKSENEISSINWQYVLYTLQGIYLCGVLMTMLTDNDYSKKNRSLNWWIPSMQLIKVE